MMSLMRFNQDPFEVTIPEFDERISISRVGIIQAEALIKRLRAYRQFAVHILSSINGVSSEHYKHLPFNTLLTLKDPLQSFLYSREALTEMIDILDRDLEVYEGHLNELKQKVENRDRENSTGSSQDTSDIQ